VPASLRLVWAEELEKWLPHLRPSSIHVIEGKEGRVARVSARCSCALPYCRTAPHCTLLPYSGRLHAQHPVSTSRNSNSSDFGAVLMHGRS
jgi:SNF2 family DNA or RNA helicase